jgi:hypothetical protein
MNALLNVDVSSRLATLVPAWRAANFNGQNDWTDLTVM